MFNRYMLGIGLIFLCANASHAENVKKNTARDVNTNRWETYCVGRYLINLPRVPGQELKTSDSLFGNNIFWEQNLADHQDVQAQIDQMKANLESRLMADDPTTTLLPREDGQPYFVKQIEYPNGGIGILVRNTPYGNPNSYILYNYFIAKDPFRVFSYKVGSIFDSNFDQMLAQSQQVAKLLHGRETHEIPIGPGICIHGGFIPGEHDYLSEATDIKMNYPYYSEKYYFQIGIGNIVVGKPMTVHPRKKTSAYPPIKETLRNSSDKKAAGLEGMEYAYIRENDEHPGIPLYNFQWHFPGVSGSSQNPHLAIYMGYVIRGLGKKKAAPAYMTFTNEKQALAMWDTILNSVRRRPEQ